MTDTLNKTELQWRRLIGYLVREYDSGNALPGLNALRRSIKRGGPGAGPVCKTSRREAILTAYKEGLIPFAVFSDWNIDPPEVQS